jgi:hypothetical protein
LPLAEHIAVVGDHKRQAVLLDQHRMN